MMIIGILKTGRGHSSLNSVSNMGPILKNYSKMTLYGTHLQDLRTCQVHACSKTEQRYSERCKL